MTGVLVQRDDQRQDCRAPSSSLHDSHLDSRMEGSPWQLWGVWSARATSRDFLVCYDLKVLWREAYNMWAMPQRYVMSLEPWFWRSSFFHRNQPRKPYSIGMGSTLTSPSHTHTKTQTHSQYQLMSLKSSICTQTCQRLDTMAFLLASQQPISPMFWVTRIFTTVEVFTFLHNILVRSTRDDMFGTTYVFGMGDGGGGGGVGWGW